MAAFKEELAQLISKYTINKALNTEDFLVASLVVSMLVDLKAFNDSKDYYNLEQHSESSSC